MSTSLAQYKRKSKHNRIVLNTPKYWPNSQSEDKSFHLRSQRFLQLAEYTVLESATFVFRFCQIQAFLQFTYCGLQRCSIGAHGITHNRVVTGPALTLWFFLLCTTWQRFQKYNFIRFHLQPQFCRANPSS